MDAAARSRLSASLVRLAAGDREAFDDVFRALWPPVLALSRRLLTNEAEAEDAAQEAVLKVFQTVDEYDPGRDALSWAFAITAFEARTLRKRRARRREAGGPVPEGTSAATPEVELEDAEVRARLAEAVDLLSEQDRAEISGYLGLSDGAGAAMAPAQRKRRQRALARLKSIWRSLHGFHA